MGVPTVTGTDQATGRVPGPGTWPDTGDGPVTDYTGDGPVAARRRELGRCLRAYRELTPPRSAGLPAGGRRRTPGLRREEVAALAGVGITWYTWLEQGRVTASDPVLHAVGRVLGIDAAGREHLCRLSRPATPDAAPASAAVGPGAADPRDLRGLLASWPDHPAVLLDGRLGALAANTAWGTQVGVPAVGDPRRDSVLWQLTADPVALDRLDGAEDLLRALHRRFRMDADLRPHDPASVRTREALRTDAPDRAPLWDCRGVGAFGRPRVRVGGRERLAHLLTDDGAPGTGVLVLLPG